MTGAALLSLASGQSWYSGAFHPWFLFGFLFWLLPIFAFGLLIFLAARWLSRSGGHDGHPRSSSGALGILEERYAKGEITKEQFEQMRKEVRG